MTRTKSKPATSAVKELLLADPDGLREVVRAVMQEMLEAEMSAALVAEKGERTPERLGYRSGYYGRTLITRVGKLELRVPQDREGHFSTELFERYQRSERALVATLAEMYVQGVSTRKVKAITEELRPRLLGLGDLGDQPAAGREPRRLCRPPARRALPLPHPRRLLREGARGRRGDEPGGADRRRNRLGRPPPDPRRRDGQPREPLLLEGLPARLEGPRPAWRRVRRRRRPCRPQGRHPRGPHRGRLPALLRSLPEEALDHLPRKHADDCLQELRSLYDRRDVAEARADLAEWLAKWQGKYPRLTAWAEDTIEETFTYFRLPMPRHKHMKSTNMLERLNEEIRRRTYVVRIFPNPESCRRLVRLPT